jgi:hypothetical protein
MNDQETPRRAETDQRDRSDVGEPPAPSGAEQGGTNRWLLLLDVGLTWLLPSILVAMVAMVALLPFEWVRALNQYQVNYDGTFKLQWVVAGGVAVGLLFMAGAYGRRPEADKERVLQVACTLFLGGALVVAGIALALLDASGG